MLPILLLPTKYKSRHLLPVTHNDRAANTLSEPLTACYPDNECSLTFNKLVIFVD